MLLQRAPYRQVGGLFDLPKRFQNERKFQKSTEVRPTSSYEYFRQNFNCLLDGNFRRNFNCILDGIFIAYYMEF